MAWRVARSLEVLRQQFNARYPTRKKTSDGGVGDAVHAARSSDHNPWVGPASDGMMLVTARDFTHDPACGMDTDRITDELAASRDPRIKYLIANGYILDTRPGFNPWRWMPYRGTNLHTKHFHISVMPELCDDDSPWNVRSFNNTPTTGAQEVDDLTPEQAAQLTRIETELLGPRGENGRIHGWGTEIGARTVVAMLVDLYNAVIAPKPSRVPGAEQIMVPLADAVRDNNAVIYQLPAMINAAGGTDPAAVAAAMRPVLVEVVGPVIREAVTAALGDDNEHQADAIVTELAQRLAGRETA
ncbi:hypothetical protein AB0I53_09930 [Saccharopolyspora sp. NPDC050389]|uniref:hypothetical protein n=1 Tax=Saccharopolyspora sp. NPDC050389 TaxID=3155516 RepID=UPI00340BED0C